MSDSKNHILVVSPVDGSPGLIAERCQRLHASLGEHAEREKDKSNYSFDKLFRLAFDNMVVSSATPLKLTVKFGMGIRSVTTLAVMFHLWQYLRDDITIGGYTSLILPIWFLLSVVGMYVGKTFDRAKKHPTYVIQSMKNYE